MNRKLTKIENNIVLHLMEHPFSTQRYLADVIGCSLGLINQTIKSLKEMGLLEEENQISGKARDLVKNNSPCRAVILAAGTGMRMAPINIEVSKGMLEVKGEVLIERTIRQLQEKGIRNIVIVVGFMKEQYEYLIDRYRVELIVNPQYVRRNNLYSLYLAREYLENSYIIPCDIWCEKNPFQIWELTSW